MIEHLHKLATHAYYCGEMELGRRASEQLLRLDLSPQREAVVRRNRTWYTQPLDEIASTRFVQFTVEPAHEGWSLFNPSIVATDAGWTVNVRSSNYKIGQNKYAIPSEDSERIRTENLLVDLSDDLVALQVTNLTATYPATPFPVEGLEDVRLNVVDGELIASATVRNFAPHDGTCRIATAVVDRTSRTFADIRCTGTPPGQHEKNWMPILGRREWLYHCHARDHVATVVDDAGDWQVTGHSPAPIVARGFRGGSQLVPAGEGKWLACIHEVAEDGPKRIYEHRFVEFDFDAGWAISGVSRPFVFREPRSIEFCAGMAIKGLRAVLTFGVRDADAWAVEIPLPEIWRLLERT